VVLWTLAVVAGLPVLCMGLVTGGASTHHIVPLHVRNGKIRGRGLLRHGTLPVGGSVHDGYFYAELKLGTPPRPFNVIIDTGSTMTYVPCSMCQQCGPNHQDPFFNPSHSSTASMLGCKDDFCDRDRSNVCRDDKCYYALNYVEGSSSEGWLLQDMYLLPDNKTPMPVVFGCETSEDGQIYYQKADGLLGMGNSQTALHSQLAENGSLDHVFSLCFGYPDGGAMVLGSAQLATDSTMRYTPMKPTMGYSFFQVDITDMRLGNSSINIPPEIFSVGDGVIMDSGTTVNYLPTVAYKAFFAALEKALAALPYPPKLVNSDCDICWGGLPEHFEELEGIFPTVELEFMGGVVLKLLPYRYLFRTGAKTYCLGVLDNGSDGTLIGGLAVRNMMVQYDVVRQRVGFAEADCQQIGKDAKDGNAAAAKASVVVRTVGVTEKAPAAAAGGAAAATPTAATATAGDIAEQTAVEKPPAAATVRGAAAAPTTAAAGDIAEQTAVENPPAAATVGKAGAVGPIKGATPAAASTSAAGDVPLAVFMAWASFALCIAAGLSLY